MNNIFQGIIYVSLISSILIIILSIMNKFAVRKYSLKWIQYLWLLVAVRLLLPSNIFAIPITGNVKIYDNQINIEKSEGIKSKSSNSGELQLIKNKDIVDKDTKETLFNKTKWTIKNSNDFILEFELLYHIIKVIGGIWLIGVIWNILKYSVSYYIFYQRLRIENEKIEDSISLNILKILNKKNRRVNIYRNHQVTAPFSVGLYNKSIILPDKEYDRQELEVILCHEYTHIVNHDIWFKVLLCVVKSIHWFNPFVYWMEHIVSQNMELRCDEEVIRERGLEYRKMYAHTILEAFQNIEENKNVVFVSNINGEGKRLKERFQNIMKPFCKKKTPIVITLICLLLIGGSIVRIQSFRVNDKVENIVGVPDAVMEFEQDDVEQEGLITVLILGLDDCVGSSRSDSIVLATWNPKSRELSVTNLARDLYVEIPDNEENKLMAAYTLGGVELVKKTVKLNFGVDVDYIITVDFDGFEKVIDAIGGVSVELTEEEVAYLNNTNYISKKSNRNVQEGINLLNGDQALGYVRVRHVSTGSGNCNDFGRIERLQVMCKNILERVSSLSILEYSSLLHECIKSVETDMSLKDCVKLFKSIQKEDYALAIQTIPLDGHYEAAQRDNKSVLLWDREVHKEMLQEICSEGMN